MGTLTKIEWCDKTFNPWIGCTKVSPGCAHCYAEARDLRFEGGIHWGKGATRRRTSAANRRDPLKWNADARKARETYDAEPTYFHLGEPPPRRPRVFCASLADWLDDEVPIEWLADLLRLIRRTPNLDWLLLTKRPQNWKTRLDAVVCSEPMRDPDDCFPDSPRTLSDWIIDWYNDEPPQNVWWGTTIEDQQRADERIPQLLAIPARVRFLSCEPLLGPVDLGLIRSPAGGRGYFDWVICGGESGANARPMRLEWARGLRDQCRAAGVPFFFKQWGEYIPFDQAAAAGIKMPLIDAMNHAQTGAPIRVGKVRAGRLLDGVEWNEFPK